MTLDDAREIQRMKMMGRKVNPFLLDLADRIVESRKNSFNPKPSGMTLEQACAILEMSQISGASVHQHILAQAKQVIQEQQTITGDEPFTWKTAGFNKHTGQWDVFDEGLTAEETRRFWEQRKPKFTKPKAKVKKVSNLDEILALAKPITHFHVLSTKLTIPHETQPAHF